MTYTQAPDYNRQPSYHPPPGFGPSGDQKLLDVLAHTLVPISKRASPPWLGSHPYTTH